MTSTTLKISLLVLAMALPHLGSVAGLTIGPVTIGPGGGTGDPVLTSFDGRSFEFMGDVGKFYSLISERSHQLSMRLKLGQMFDHNGTYMDGIGFMYQQHKVLVEIDAAGNLEVVLDGKRLQMSTGETEQEHILALEQGELMINWEHHRAGLGQAVEITSDMLSVVAYLTPAGTLDEGGVVQPAYINFDADLLSPPAGAMKGVIGEGYERLMNPKSVPEEDDYKFHGVEKDYEQASYFSTSHPSCMFGVPADTSSIKRRLAERVHVAFPLHFSSVQPKRLPQASSGAQPSLRSLLGASLRVNPMAV
ncbi:hypothetical protein CVIRNUC_007681 [Coccomyxa viridis]|uniref:Uncharacterized protein n=1 Tax=Coccomyxa viridis TaxID=1274662 RepID=A0AAV1ICM5_9CHLO|nr:hypothetical protein CVIRNUC_007681 [Coccomyxa viridis]